MVSNPPMSVRLTYFQGHLIPMVEIWERAEGCTPDSPTSYPYMRIGGPNFAEESEYLAALVRADSFLFVERKEETP